MQPAKITPISDVIFTDFDGKEGILVDLNTKQYYRLNETGSLIWRGLEKGNSIDDIVSQIQDRYDVPTDHARGSVEKLLLSLESKKLVKRN